VCVPIKSLAAHFFHTRAVLKERNSPLTLLRHVWLSPMNK
jgi:hypothetical protein